MVEKHSELSGNTYAIFIPTLNPEEPDMLSMHMLIQSFEAIILSVPTPVS